MGSSAYEPLHDSVPRSTTDASRAEGSAHEPRQDPEVAPEHRVQLYETDAFLLDRVGELIGSTLEAGGAGVVIARRPHREGVEHRLIARGIDLTAARAKGALTTLDAEETLASFMVRGRPDAERFRSVVGGAIAAAARVASRGRVSAFGEMVAVLWANGQSEAALELEVLWNALVRERRFELVCGYPIGAFGDETGERGLERVTALHGDVVTAESYSGLGDTPARRREVARLQQQAERLEREVAKRKKLEAELQRQVTKLAEADRRKDEFLATLGHELRNPLAAVVYALRLLRSRGVTPEGFERTRELIERNVEHTTRLVDDLLEVSRITQGRIELREETVVLSSLVERVVQTAEPLLAERGHRLTVDLPPDPVRFRADPARLEQVLGNLLHNAARYTDVGGRIWLEARADDAYVTLSVRDDGPGIEPRLRANIFDLFVQGSSNGAASRGGLGIGLTLVKRLVELHGGTVEVHSDGPGSGAAFVVRLPLRTPARRGEGAAPTAIPPQHRILIVDDNVDAAEPLAELLRQDGHQVHIARSGAAGIDEAIRTAPDLVLVDIGMPDVDGYEVARRLRGNPALPSVRLVALTGYGGAALRRRSLESGFDEHLTKPVDLAQLTGLLGHPSERD